MDDPCGAISVHGVNGAWGVLSLGLFADGVYGEGFNGVPGAVRGLFYGDASQFLAEAILISLAGGFVGTLAGLCIPVSVRLFTDYHLPISGLSAIIAIVVSSIVGIIFGTVPATRASQLDPVESLRYE